MKTVSVIGAGQLGSRHLQALALSDIEILIEVVEPFDQARDVAKQRFEEMPENDNIKGISFFSSILDLSNELDLVVVATNSDVRSDVVTDLLNSKKVDNLILEKVLFQKEEEYLNMDKLLTKTKTKCWVNHPRRIFPFYQSLKDKLSGSKQINFSVSGGNWGLGCNGLHFLDVFEFLSSNNNTVIDNSNLEKEIVETKRKGFVEFNGMLTGSIGVNTFSINCFKEQFPISFSITSDKLNITIDESKGWYSIVEKSAEWDRIVNNEKIIYFQSELTHSLLKDIFSKNDCGLATYGEAMHLHLKFLQSLIDHMNSFSKTQYDHCPIT